jgi:regulation of enolase protein 1 (concanavalin A-like superfamily)
MDVRHRRALCAAGAILLSIAAVASAGAQTLPAGWTASNVGNPAIGGAATASNGTFSVSGAGADVWDTADQFTFVHRAMTGDGSIVAKVTGLTNTDAWTKAGVMIRESLGAGSSHAFALVSVAKGAALQRRRATNATSLHTGAPGTAPMWVRLQRAGSTITASQSPDGVTWTTIGTDQLQLPATIYVGLAITSHNAAALATATFSNVAVVSAVVVSGWNSADIGTGMLPGSWTMAGSRHTVTGAGRDIWDTADAFRFTYQPVTGDVDIVARVSAIANVDAWTKAGLMVRSTLAAGSAHASLFVSPGKGVAFQRRPADNAISVHTAAGTQTAPWWVKLGRRGSTITAFQSADGTNWSVVGTQALALPSTFYVGLAVTSHNASALATATFDDVAIEPRSGPNQVPTVALTSPAAGALLRTPGPVAIAAAAGDADGAVTRVEFYANETLIGTRTSAPYVVSWNQVAAGTYDVTAVARDNEGGTTVSGARRDILLDPQVPGRVLFGPSSNHETRVDHYVVEFFLAGTDTTAANPVAARDIGKPPVLNGECAADIIQMVAGLPPGTYIATVKAIGDDGEARSAPSPPFPR